METRAQNIHKRLNTTRLKSVCRDAATTCCGLPEQCEIGKILFKYLSGTGVNSRRQERRQVLAAGKFFIRVFIGDRGVFKDTSRSRGPVSHQGKKRTQPRSDDLSS